MTLKYAESNDCSDHNDSSDYNDYNDSRDYNDYNDKVGRSAESIYWAEQSHYSASQVQM